MDTHVWLVTPPRPSSRLGQTLAPPRLFQLKDEKPEGELGELRAEAE